MYINIKKTVKTEEIFVITERLRGWSPKRIHRGLMEGNLTLVPVTCIEQIVWLVDNTGKRIAILEKDGGMGPDETTMVTMGPLSKARG